MSDPVYGHQVKRPMRVRALQAASLVLAVAGLILLYLYSVNREIPTVQISEITPTMNFAYVQITGEVTRDAYIFKSGGIVFNLNDGTGEIAVMGGRAQAEALKNAGKLPRYGDRVEVAGSLNVSAEQEIKLRMQSATQMTLRRKRKARRLVEPNISLSDIKPAHKGDTVFVVGLLKEISLPRPGSKAPYVLTIEDAGTELEIIFWDKVFQGLEQKLPTLGQKLSARGRVDIYRGKLQLKIWEATELRELTELEGREYRTSNKDPKKEPEKEPEKEKKERHGGLFRIDDITANQEGDIFTVIGTLGEPRSIRRGVIYPIADESGEMVVLFWDKQVSGEERDALESGIRLRVTAPLVVYKGILELVPENVGAFSVESME